MSQVLFSCHRFPLPTASVPFQSIKFGWLLAFIYLLTLKGKRERQRQTYGEFSAAFSLPKCQQLAWDGPKLKFQKAGTQSRSLTQGTGTQLLKSSLAAPMSRVYSNMKQELGVGPEPGHSDVRGGYLLHRPNTCLGAVSSESHLHFTPITSTASILTVVFISILSPYFFLFPGFVCGLALEAKSQ